jgi:hypothetical protein
MYGLLVGTKHERDNLGVLKTSLLFAYERFVGAGGALTMNR